METSRKYKSNPSLIALGVIGGLCALIWIISRFVFTIEILSFEMAGQEVKLIVLLYFSVMIWSAGLVYMDAGKINAGEAAPEQKTFRAMTWSPASWGGLVFFLWILMFPYYMNKREEIYWQNISVEYSALKTIERDITPQIHRPTSPPEPVKKEYADNIGTCPTCDTPYPLRMLERSKFCNRCGEKLVKGE